MAGIPAPRAVLLRLVAVPRPLGRAAELGMAVDEALLAIAMVYVIKLTEDFVADARARFRSSIQAVTSGVPADH